MQSAYEKPQMHLHHREIIFILLSYLLKVHLVSSKTVNLQNTFQFQKLLYSLPSAAHRMFSMFCFERENKIYHWQPNQLLSSKRNYRLKRIWECTCLQNIFPILKTVEMITVQMHKFQAKGISTAGRRTPSINYVRQLKQNVVCAIS